MTTTGRLTNTIVGPLVVFLAREYDNDDILASRYEGAAWEVVDRVAEAGWDDDLLPSALVVAHEERSLLTVRQDDSQESFKRRHQSGKPCDQAMSQAQLYLTGAMPKPVQ